MKKLGKKPVIRVSECRALFLLSLSTITKYNVTTNISGKLKENLGDRGQALFLFFFPVFFQFASVKQVDPTSSAKGVFLQFGTACQDY